MTERQEFEHHPALASWIERIANAPLDLPLGDWMIFVGAINQAIASERLSRQRTEAENETLRLAICGGEDAPGYAASLPLADILKVQATNLQATGEWIDEANAFAREVENWKSAHAESEARAQAAEASNAALVKRVVELTEIVAVVLQADREALADHRPKWGLADCVDNDGKPYQSHFLGDALARARSLAPQPTIHHQGDKP